MDIEAIKKIVNDDDMLKEIKEDMIFEELVKDGKIIPNMIKLLGRERSKNRELILDMNLELSRAHVYIEEIDFKNVKTEEKKRFNKTFVVDNIAKFYYKYSKTIKHCFNRFN